MRFRRHEVAFTLYFVCRHDAAQFVREGFAQCACFGAFGELAARAFCPHGVQPLFPVVVFTFRCGARFNEVFRVSEGAALSVDKAVHGEATPCRGFNAEIGDALTKHRFVHSGQLSGSHGGGALFVDARHDDVAPAIANFHRYDMAGLFHDVQLARVAVVHGKHDGFGFGSGEDAVLQRAPGGGVNAAFAGDGRQVHFRLPYKVLCRRAGCSSGLWQPPWRW